MKYIQDAAEILSLVLTSPTIFLSCWVVLMFRHEALKAYKTVNRTPMQWFVMGVTIGFIGSILDNAYWGVAWTSSYLELPSTKFWFNNGVFANIPFRQGCGVLAAYCHVRCGLKHINTQEPDKEEIRKLSRLISISLAAGLAGMFVLFWLRSILN